MTDSPGSPQAWQKLGRDLIRRRVQLSPAYRNRRVFCEEQQLDPRLVFDIETAKRTNFRMATLLDVARGYMIESGSIDAVLRGDGDLEPVPGSPGSAAPATPQLAIPQTPSPGISPAERHAEIMRDVAREVEAARREGRLVRPFDNDIEQIFWENFVPVVGDMEAIRLIAARRQHRESLARDEAEEQRRESMWRRRPAG